MNREKVVLTDDFPSSDGGNSQSCSFVNEKETVYVPTKKTLESDEFYAQDCMLTFSGIQSKKPSPQSDRLANGNGESKLFHFTSRPESFC